MFEWAGTWKILDKIKSQKCKFLQIHGNKFLKCAFIFIKIRSSKRPLNSIDIIYKMCFERIKATQYREQILLSNLA